MLTTFNEIDMTAVIDIRKRHNEEFQKRYGIKLGFMSFFVKAAISALKAFPQVNAELDGEELVFKHYYDIGMAVGSSEGLVVPVLRDADRKTLEEISAEVLQRCTVLDAPVYVSLGRGRGTKRALASDSVGVCDSASCARFGIDGAL